MTSRSDNPRTDSCWNAALRLVARRDHFSTEVERKLKERGFAAPEIAATIERLRKMRYLDDRRALAAYAEEMKRHHKGFFFFLKKLVERGARGLFSDDDLRTAYSLDEEREVAQELERKMRWNKEERHRKLRNRGFSVEMTGDSESDQ